MTMITPPVASISNTSLSDLVGHAMLHMEFNLTRPLTPCKVCGGRSTLFDVLDFNKRCTPSGVAPSALGVPVYYRRCADCSFIGTDFFDNFSKTQWTGLVYNDDYYLTVDPEYREIRPKANAAVIDALLCVGKQDWFGLDYGGGNGSTAQHLRDMGYLYDCHDPFGSSTVTDKSRRQFNFCSVFEVAEHTPDPKMFLADLLSWCSPDRLAILIGTHVHDNAMSDATKLNWWYAAPRNGHVSLYSRQSLKVLAGQFGLDCLSFTEQTHLLTRGYSHSEAWRFLVRGKLRGRLRRLLSPQPCLSV